MITNLMNTLWDKHHILGAVSLATIPISTLIAKISMILGFLTLSFGFLVACITLWIAITKWRIWKRAWKSGDVTTEPRVRDFLKLIKNSNSEIQD